MSGIGLTVIILVVIKCAVTRGVYMMIRSDFPTESNEITPSTDNHQRVGNLRSKWFWNKSQFEDISSQYSPNTLSRTTWNQVELLYNSTNI